MTDLMQQDVGNRLSEKTSIEEVLAGAELAPAQSLWTTEASGSVQLRMDELCPEHPITVHQMFTNSVQKYRKLTALASKRGNKGIMAGIYTTNSPDACLYVANDSRANIIVVENQKQLDKILEVKDKLPHLKAIVQYSGSLREKLPNLYSWEEFMGLGPEVSEQELDEVICSQKANQCCVLIYTSGTTRSPKGVMLSHDNITWTAHHASRAGDMQPAEIRQESLVSYLPLSHIAAQIYDRWTEIQWGEQVSFAQPDALKGSLVDTLREVTPTAHMGVPRVWEKIVEKIKEGIPRCGYMKRKLVTRAMSVSLEANQRLPKHEKSFLFTLADSLVLQKLRAELGFSNCMKLFSGAAPIGSETLQFFLGLNIRLYEAYGMSESSGPHFMSGPKVYQFSSCGKVVPGCQYKLVNVDGDGIGEVCFWGHNIFMGFLNLKDKTKEALDEDGWLQSGDLGKVDEDGFLYITGRIKELIITAGGENIPPLPIEDAVKQELPIISNAMLIGDKRTFLSMLLTLKCTINPETTEPTDILSLEAVEFCQWLGSQSTKVSDIIGGKDKLVYQSIEEGIARVNSKATSNAQRIQKWTILGKDFSIVGGELGPTMKLCRPVVLQMYHSEIESFYSQSYRRN
ncbi:long-chain-fatty-acid--CoA ligase ACSBG1 isoform X1 [Sinocyclocheilus anshuiensis]|uniref:long-chain-fatty-acid--CoA ligase n=1 Tax=Sinocyclocheilus anshuiensis TaxID=1608454 RepID=A0A671N4P0_9TELE|nr:PREDICTED: long-chain-fatty-acid--CoA ligase ACSBG1-like isoform X1 [Sinocyclocheilus anshuiensis]XP_016354675.1 PREDICTED: long-chain-fatty-acid--CoA ligase ACSBG1-like isoform X1 [Sinocyclocheilus anshuiensis]